MEVFITSIYNWIDKEFEWNNSLIYQMFQTLSLCIIEFNWNRIWQNNIESFFLLIEIKVQWKC